MRVCQFRHIRKYSSNIAHLFALGKRIFATTTYFCYHVNMDRKINKKTTPKRRTAANKRAASDPKRTRTMAIAAGVLLVLLIAVLLHGGNKTSSVKPLIDAPLSEEEAKEVVYTQGVDVSNYQGDIDFDVLHEQGIQFVFIKATEGNAWVDQRFAANWAAAKACDGMRYGAYHFMSFRTPGSEQAASFIDTVPKDRHALPPVVDIELYEEFINDPPSQEHFRETLDPILTAMEDQYGKQPIIYTTAYVYTRYIQNNYDNPIWIADHSLPAALPDGSPWLFCQYSYEGVLDGYNGEASYIDLDVFNGSLEELEDL